jgi:hypothetical protein
MKAVTRPVAQSGQARRFLRGREGKERGLMPKQKTKKSLVDTADTVRPYVERAMNDEKLRSEVMRAFSTARELYGELLTGRDRPITLASRVATDDDVRDKLREAIEDLRSASERLQGKRERSSNRASTLIVAGIALGILFNPVTGAETRRFIRDLMSSGGGTSDEHDHGSNGRP